MWYVDERVAAKPYDDGELMVICTTNGVENEQGWKSVQLAEFIPRGLGSSFSDVGKK